MKALTKSEMQVMNILWDMQRGACVADVLARYDEPRPAYTTAAIAFRERWWASMRLAPCWSGGHCFSAIISFGTPLDRPR